jgi:hydrogenase assembly chaperone HypC/HupF
MCLGELGTVTALGPDATATIDVRGATRTVSALLHPDLVVGDHVLVHTGYVVQVMGEREAAEAQALRDQL